MQRRIVGIDPGLRHTGWGVIEQHENRLSYIACGTIHTKQSDSMADRLATLHHGISDILARFCPNEVAVEETFINTNALSSLKLGHARGAIMVTVSLAGLSPKEYAATQVKKSVVGVGRAEKEQVEMMVKMLLPGAKIDSADAADALAVAICHAHHHTTLVTGELT